MLRSFLLILLLSNIGLTVVRGQQAKQAIDMSRPKSSKQALAELGVKSDPESLRTALLNADENIRGLAAMRLAADKLTTVAPEIERALSKETNPYTRLKMAGSLFQLAPAVGLPYMTDLCTNQQAGKSVMLNAALALVLLDSQGTSASSCVPQLMRLLDDSEAPLIQANALSILNSYRSKLGTSDLDELRAQSIRFVASPIFGLKAAAVHSLVADSSPAARDALKRAADEERNPEDQKFIKDVMQKGISSQTQP